VLRHEEITRGPLRGMVLMVVNCGAIGSLRAGSHAADRVGGSEIEVRRPRGDEVVFPGEAPLTK
jgi:hypothetical protein